MNSFINVTNQNNETSKQSIRRLPLISHSVFPLHRYGKWATTDYALVKCKESYGMNNAIGYPHEERPAGRPTYRISGVHSELLNAGAFMGFHSGWEQPDWYAAKGEVAEYKPSFNRYYSAQNQIGLPCIGYHNYMLSIILSPIPAFILYNLGKTIMKLSKESTNWQLTMLE